MMLSALALIAVIQPQQTAAALVSKMIANYHDVKSMTGEIVMTQTMMGRSIKITTKLQFEKPCKVYIKQEKTGADPLTWLVTSDGQIFSYDAPNSRRENYTQKNSRLIESCNPGTALTYQDVYRAAALSLGDRAAPLDLAFGRLEDLRYLRGQWKTVESGGEENVNGESLQMVKGLWREYADAPHSGVYSMWLTEKGDLRRYAIKETFQVRTPDGNDTGAQEVLTLWEIRLNPNATVDPSLFKVVR